MNQQKWNMAASTSTGSSMILPKQFSRRFCIKILQPTSPCEWKLQVPIVPSNIFLRRSRSTGTVEAPVQVCRIRCRTATQSKCRVPVRAFYRLASSFLAFGRGENKHSIGKQCIYWYYYSEI
jgi:hypothetical protein